ncbi:unnamed protein product [Cyprideis torosa]|uniref:Uncharacterized protein n=1 Tax=Cyprideis torosa TaxID=163714 RepID=A0A7R8W009_9CRUS|nr:unnamed protein product [Cyprideis torosa]CAG0879248.1 unnamed protein product [Cyprideis torosa]
MGWRDIGEQLRQGPSRSAGLEKRWLAGDEGAFKFSGIDIFKVLPGCRMWSTADGRETLRRTFLNSGMRPSGPPSGHPSSQPSPHPPGPPPPNMPQFMSRYPGGPRGPMRMPIGEFNGPPGQPPMMPNSMDPNRPGPPGMGPMNHRGGMTPPRGMPPGPGPMGGFPCGIRGPPPTSMGGMPPMSMGGPPGPGGPRGPPPHWPPTSSGPPGSVGPPPGPGTPIMPSPQGKLLCELSQGKSFCCPPSRTAEERSPTEPLSDVPLTPDSSGSGADGMYPMMKPHPGGPPMSSEYGGPMSVGGPPDSNNGQMGGPPMPPTMNGEGMDIKGSPSSSQGGPGSQPPATPREGDNQMGDYGMGYPSQGGENGQMESAAILKIKESMQEEAKRFEKDTPDHSEYAFMQ